MIPLSTRYWASLPIFLAVLSVAVATAENKQGWNRGMHWASEPLTNDLQLPLFLLLLYIQVGTWMLKAKGQAEVSRGLWTPQAMYIKDKLEPSKEGSQQDSPGLASYFPPMKAGLVEYANKRPKIVCLHPVLCGMAKVVKIGPSFDIKEQV